MNKHISVIVPTYREVENLPELTKRISLSLSAESISRWEIVIVDDNSQDGTVELCRQLSSVYPVRLLVRENERGLSSAVLHGMQHAQGDVLVVMDADLSHPPEKIPELVAALDDKSVDFAIGSRYVPGAKTDENWGVFRWLNSKIATLLARPFTKARDPMAGFFAIRRETLMRGDKLNPIGYKIALELIVKCGCVKVKEVPIEFRDRRLGQSKLNLREQINYLVHIARLWDYKFEHLTCPVKFCLVGATGMAVDLATLAVLLQLTLLPFFVSRALAIWVAMTWNFALNRQFTFRKELRPGWVTQYLLFCASCLLGAIANWGVSVGLSHSLTFFGNQPLLAAIFGVAAGTGLNYLCNRHLTFRPSGSGNQMPTIPFLFNRRGALTPLLTPGRNWQSGLLTVLALAVVLRLMAMAVVPLIPEEAYYWMYAKHPALSYYDHPPMVAWLIGAGTLVFGDTEFGVRIVGSLLMIGASLLMYRFGRSWFSTSAGVLAALLLQILPAYFGIGFIATMDSALVFFWMLCLVGVTYALKDHRPWGWYLAGIGLGAALLSKYTGIFLAGGTFLAIIAYRPWRRHLLSIHPYLGLLLAMALFSPVVVWNAQNDWASFRFQFMERWGNEPLSVGTVLSFIGFQLVIVTPLFLWGGLRFVGKLRRDVFDKKRLPAPGYIIALAFSLPLLAVMTYKSFKYGVHFNWTLPAYLSLFPAISQWIVIRLRDRIPNAMRLPWKRGMAWTAMTCVTINFLGLVYLLVLQPRWQLISAFGPWKALAQIVEKYEEDLERTGKHEPIIVADGKYRLASVLAFYRNELEHGTDKADVDCTTSQWVFGGEGLGFPYWQDATAWQGRDVLYITDKSKDTQQLLARHFDEVENMPNSTIGDKTYRFAIGRNLR